MDEAPIKPIEKKNAATKRMRVRFTRLASFIFGDGRHVRKAHGNIKADLCVPKTSSKTPELAGIRWLAWRRLVCSSSPSATIPSRTALSRDFAARKRQEFAAS